MNINWLKSMESQGRQLRNLGVYTAVILLIFALVIPLWGEELTKAKQAVKEPQLSPVLSEPTDSGNPLTEPKQPAPVPGLAEERTAKPASTKSQDSLPNQVNNRDSRSVDLKKMIWPLKGEILLGFGMNYSKTFSDYRFHNGTDIKGKQGTIVAAVLPGKVGQVEYDKEQAKAVVIEHGSGWRSVYSHLEEVFVQPNSEIKAGQPLGSIGQPGLDEVLEGPHLHFTLFRQEQTVNPLDYLPKQ